ncbi:GTP binding domain and P-loop containing nucleoside triphosphate hydrolase domain-containing protein [Strongyloides ratti]|uniref:GTP binding domain and P-loop containing nucleoside triphosphate hydrolase domain-containing protein n=1 Tax=Strongyloides ratti TaxID=34506 RepID=A0A090LA35_STRRB|nr:GTP binding domain and P-loop containing nucleoside triphosphate hydrolase domain-containing protein [Strongyloides ratti]CEF65003.1 GTP binding domain and P-loop containing nucleoside triphosphate hydrolase domain-containing protein [Strongyloides ratti]
MNNTTDLLNNEKKKKKKTKKRSKTQSTTEATTEDNSTTKKKRGKSRDKIHLDDQGNFIEDEGRKRRGSYRKLKKAYEIMTKKIIHDPKLIGVLPSLPLFYQQIVVPVRDRHNYNEQTKTVGWDFNEILAKPSILVIGSSNAGKTSLINYLLREKKGYQSHYDAVKDFKSSLTHLIYDESPKLIRNSDTVNAKSWPFREITKFNKEKNGCQLQLLQIKSPLLKEITFIDSPPLTDDLLPPLYMLASTGYYQLLSNLIRKVDLIFFVTTSNAFTSSIDKIIPLLSPYIYKTVFCLNKSDQYKNFADLTKDRKKFSDIIFKLITTGEPKILCTYFKGYLSTSEIRKYVHDDMETLLSRIKKFPTQYKVSRLLSLQIHMLETIQNAYIHNEIRKREKKSLVKILLNEDRDEINKNLADLPYSETFLKNFNDDTSNALEKCNLAKVKNMKPDDIDALRAFLINDYPYIQSVAEEEPEIHIKFLLPLCDPNKDPSLTVNDKKKVIKEIKIAIPTNDEDEEEEEDDDDDYFKKNSVSKTTDTEKNIKKDKKKQKFITLDKATIENMIKEKN